ncbi:hypothetical protein WH285_12430 [Acinetobacter johnsonii]|uniref:hypothetical protein n=1 Tax=Acinetobacter johnsonii TaxID=40214 RepID=UPI0030A34626
MKVKFFINQSQEDEGFEIIDFHAAILSKTLENSEVKYWTEAAYFIILISTPADAYRYLDLIRFYKSVKLVDRFELTLCNGVKAIIENHSIKCKRAFCDSYEDQIDLDLFEKIISKWIDYLQGVNKETVVFEL